MDFEEDFNVTLPSNALQSFKLFPNNTLQNYTIHLNEEIRLDVENYEVGLSEIHYPNNFSYTPIIIGDINDRIHIEEYTYEDVSLKFDRHHWILVTTNPGKRYDSYQQMIDAFNAEIKDVVTNKIKNKLVQMLTLEDYEKHNRPMIRHDKVLNRIVVYNFLDKTRNKFVRIRLEKEMALRLGFHQDAFPDRCVEREWSVKAKFPIRFHTPNTQRFLFVYSDVGAPTIVGEGKVPLLRVLKVSGEPGEIVTEIFNRIYYVPVSRNFIREIEIEIKNEFGDPTLFGDNGTVIVVLSFRRKRQRIIRVQ